VGVLGLADVGRVWLDGRTPIPGTIPSARAAMIQPIATNLSLTGFVAWGEDQTKVYFATKSLF
jgi:hypothetical protein